MLQCSVNKLFTEWRIGLKRAFRWIKIKKRTENKEKRIKLFFVNSQGVKHELILKKNLIFKII